MSPNLTEDENFVLTHWSRWGADGYPIVKYGRVWIIDGIRGCGKFPTVFKTKKAASERWESYIGILLDKLAGRLEPSPGSPAALEVKHA